MPLSVSPNMGREPSGRRTLRKPVLRLVFIHPLLRRPLVHQIEIAKCNPRSLKP